MKRYLASVLLLLGSACVSGSKIRADSEVIQADIERARRNGALKCAPAELATAEAHLDFARGELSQGSSFRASEHIRTADTAVKQAIALSKDCAPKQVVVREKPEQPVKQPEPQQQTIITQTQPAQPPPVVVRIEETDTDGDGIPDRDDPCPDRAEDKDGFQDEDGCPDLDNDNDGMPDGQDKCPNEAGPAENGGCPDTDRDGDGIADRLDACPDEPGVKDEKGCPKKYKLVVVKRDKIEIKKQIKFGVGSAQLIGKESQAILDDVAQALRDAPFIKKVRIEGHTDSQGSDEVNLRLSQQRADAVMAQLIKRGIDPGRLEAVGFGEANPIASNATAKGRAENRRTEFNIIEQ